MFPNETAEALKARLERIYADHLRAPSAAKAQIINRASADLLRVFGWTMDAGRWVRVA